MKKTRINIIFLTVILPLFFSCGDMDRNNPLDPRNPNSVRAEIVLVESFVNESGGNYISSSLAAFERLLREYGSDAFIYIEHHIEKTQGTDDKALPASLDRYKLLVPQTMEQYIPDVFFDGNQGRVQGASDESAAYSRYKTTLEGELERQTLFTIEAAAKLSANQISINGKIARLGNEDAEDLVLYGYILQKMPSSMRSFVRAIVPIETIGELEHGERNCFSKSVSVQSGWDIYNLQVVVFVQNSRTMQVYQSILLDL